MKASSSESFLRRPWVGEKPPQRILLMRFHALGDIAITFPACEALRQRYPHAQIDYLTNAQWARIPEALDLFDRVHLVRVLSSRSFRIKEAIRTGLVLRKKRYDVVLDLQRNWMSRIIRRLVAPAAYSEFDRYSPRAAGERTLSAFHDAGFTDLAPQYRLRFRGRLIEDAAQLLRRSGWDGRRRLVVLNPAGLWETRNWPLASYCELSRLWLAEEATQLVVLGTTRIRRKATTLKDELGDSVINLVGLTSPDLAFALLQHVSLVISEDSGLLHMSWVSGKPTIALFGSSRADWSRPIGSHTVLFHSGDLDCGECMARTCRFGDVHCLTRYSPQEVFEASRKLLSQLQEAITE